MEKNIFESAKFGDSNGGIDMTRLEITDKAKNYEGDKLSFVDGAEWMQTRMTEKACEWLSKRLPNTTDEDIMYDNITVCDRDMIVEQFKQAMEE